MKKSTITPNYDYMRDAHCHAVQTAWDDYKKAYKKWLDSIWFNKNGEMCMMGTELYKEKANQAEAALIKAMRDLNDFDAWLKVEKELKGVFNNANL